MRDNIGRTINYLRLSITDRCNLRCCYCMPAAGVPCCGHDNILRYEDLLRIARVAAGMGIEKVRVTGGEPLVRKGVIDFLRQLKRTPGVNEVTLTTNGLLLTELAAEIKAAGVDRINVSLDSLLPETYAAITRGGDLCLALAGLECAEAEGLRIKLNMVVMRGSNDLEVEAFAALSTKRAWSVRFIEYMPTIREPGWRTRVITGAEILGRLRQRFALEPLPVTHLCGPARPYKIVGAPGTIGIITPMSEHFCGSCNRIRVTSTGQAKSCLLSDTVTDLRPQLAETADAGLRNILLEVACGKGAHHQFGVANPDGPAVPMSRIGG